METVFADSSFWIALRDKRERRHAEAGRLAQRLVDERAQIVVTLFVFSEAHAYFVRSVPLRVALPTSIPRFRHH